MSDRTGYPRSDGLTVPTPADAVHVIIGLSPDGYQQWLTSNGSADADLSPRSHAHPVLGITLHAHSAVEVARTPHTHRPTAGWDVRDPIMLEAADV